MNNLKFTNKDGLELTITRESPDVIIPIHGGDDSNPTWEEYLKYYKEYIRPHFELLKRAIEELDWVGKTSDEICNDYYFVFSDGERFAFSWRAWGDLMQAIVGRREGYMAYYMK